MTLPTDRGTPAARPVAQAGFTLIEIVVVLAVLGLMVGLILYRGAPRSPVLDLRAATGDVARTLRVARSRAIASNRRVVVLFDMGRRDISVDGASPRPMPDKLGMSVVGQAAGGARAASISFAPDGSSSGGRIDLAEGERRARIGVDWLTGRVSVGGPP